MLPDGERQRRADHQAGCIQEGIGFLADRADKAATLDGVSDTYRQRGACDENRPRIQVKKIGRRQC